jgi:hypothetical protein
MLDIQKKACHTVSNLNTREGKSVRPVVHQAALPEVGISVARLFFWFDT